MSATGDEEGARRNEALELITSRWPEPRRCPICNSSSWNVGDVIYASLLDRPQLAQLYFPVNCQVCSYTIFFDALAAGLVAEDQPDPPKEFK